MTDEEKIKLNAQEDREFAKRLDEYYNDTLDRDNPITVCKTPYALSIAGANPNLDVIINPVTIDKCTKSAEEIHHGHSLSRDIMEQIPKQLRNPAMIFASRENSVVAITELVDSKKNGVMVAVALDRISNNHYINRIASIYGKDNFKNYLRRQIKAGNLLAINTKIADKTFRTIGLQSPKEETFISYDDSIAYTMANVKYPKEKTIANFQNKEIEKFATKLEKPAEKQLDLTYINADVINDVDNRNIEKYLPPDVQISDEDDVMQVLHTLVSKNDANILNLLGVSYATGLNVERDEQKALNFFEKAAEREFPPAQRNLAIMMEKETETNREKISDLYESAARKGDAYAQNNLGVNYLTGDGVKRNSKRAVILFEKAAEQGDDLAILNLAACYAVGEGARKNPKRAFDLYLQAAEKGIASAYKPVADAFRFGKGTEQNLERAMNFYKLAAENGDVSAKKIYDAIKEKQKILTPKVSEPKIFEEKTQNKSKGDFSL